MRVLVASWVLLAGLATGCRTVQTVLPLPRTSEVELDTLQSQLMRFADDYAYRTTLALDEAAARLGTPEGKREVLRLKLNSLSGTVAIATGENPNANLVDMVSMVTLTRLALENHWTRGTDGAAYDPWLKTVRQSEGELSVLALKVMDSARQEELERLLNEWFRANPEVAQTFYLRPRLLTSDAVRSEAKQSGGVFQWAGLDPFAGLDPAVREMTEARLFAERTLYTLQRMPGIVRWQAEILLHDLGADPGFSQIMTNAAELTAGVDRASRAAELFSRVAEELPDRMTREREAILAGLEAQESRLTPLVAEVKESLEAGQAMSVALSKTLTDLTAFLKLLGVGGGDADRRREAASKPFDILEYAQTAEQITAMARELDTVVRRLNGTLDSPVLDARRRSLDGVAQDTAREARGVVTHAFLLAAAWVGLVLLAALVYRVVVKRSVATAPPGPGNSGT